MKSNPAIDQIQRLGSANPILAQQAVLGIFHSLNAQKQLDPGALAPVLEPCFAHSVKVWVLACHTHACG
jgi:hypothetical protein